MRPLDDTEAAGLEALDVGGSGLAERPRQILHVTNIFTHSVRKCITLSLSVDDMYLMPWRR